MPKTRLPPTDHELAHAIAAVYSFAISFMADVTPRQAVCVVRRLHEAYHTGPDLLGFLRIVRQIDHCFELALDDATGRRERTYQLALGYQSGSFTLRVSESEASPYRSEHFVEALRGLVDLACDESDVTSVTVPLSTELFLCCNINW
jgi:hypothetical protein